MEKVAFEASRCHCVPTSGRFVIDVPATAETGKASGGRPQLAMANETNSPVISTAYRLNMASFGDERPSELQVRPGRAGGRDWLHARTALAVCQRLCTRAHDEAQPNP